MKRLLLLSRRRGSLTSAMLLMICAAQASGQQSEVPSAAPGMPISFDTATTRLNSVSDSLAAGAAQVRVREAQASAVATLRRPEVTLDLKELDFQKSLALSTGGAGPALGLPPTLNLETGGWRFRPFVIATMPLYSGGAIAATQHAAKAGIGQARADAAITAQSVTVQLVQAYFGQQLAAVALAVRADARAGLERHFQDALKLEKQGLASRSQALQAEVARDDSERDLQKSINDFATAKAYLRNLLRIDTVLTPTTPLFVVSGPLAPLDVFLDAADKNHPQVAKFEAIGDQARAGVRLERAKQLPQVYLFGQYDLYKREALFTEPDYIFGIGLKFTLLSSTSRTQQVNAARAVEQVAAAGLMQTRNDLATATTRAYNDLDSARSQFLLLDSAIASSRENLRLQQLSYREGLATSLDVIDARLRLSGVLLQRANAAYQFDVTLAQLLAASGQADRFARYLSRADKSIAP